MFTDCHRNSQEERSLEQMALMLGHEGQIKFKYGDMAEDTGGRENGTNGMNPRWWTGRQVL